MEHRIEGTRVVLKGGHVVTFDLFRVFCVLLPF